MARIYLDNAATSWPKPTAVYDAVDRYQRDNGAPAGRSPSHEASEVARQVDITRSRIATMIGAATSSNIIFTFNGTDALNLAIQGSLNPGDHVVTTQIEHNSTLRPLRYLESQHGVAITIVPCDEHGVVDASAVKQALRPSTTLIAVNHVSNVIGTVQPIHEIGSIAKERGIRYLVDAAQSLGRTPLNVADIGCDLLAAPGHKGLLGPLGTGILYVSERASEFLRPLRFGGTGTVSDQDMQPDSVPDKFESGNHNIPGLLGLSEGAKYVLDRTVEEIERHEQSLAEQLIAGMRELDDVELHGPRGTRRQLGVVSFNVADYDPRELATMLETAYGIQGRPGLHCAPLIHKALRTIDRGGSMRLSVGPFTTSAEIETTVNAIRELTDA